MCVKSCEIHEADGVLSITRHAVSVALPQLVAWVQQEVGQAQEYGWKTLGCPVNGARDSSVVCWQDSFLLHSRAKVEDQDIPEREY